MDETLNINLTNDEYPILEVSLVQAVGPKGADGGWFNLKGDWSLGIAYVPYDLVNTTTGSYVCVAANIDSEPTVNNPDWMRLTHTVTDENKIDKTSIKQTLGVSTTDLLSQNIITTNINRIDDELSNKIDISQLSNYYTKSETYHKSEIDRIIGESTGGFNTVVVNDIVEMTDENTIYLTFKDIPGQNNIYNKYIVFEGVPELLTDISKSDLSNFITLNDLNRYVSDVDLDNLIRDYYNKNSVYNKTEIDNLLANLNLEIDTSGFATIELLGEYIPFSKIKQSTGSSDSDLMSQKAITDLINSILNGLQDDLGDRPTRPQIDDLLDDYIRDTLLGKPNDLREPNVILNDLINGGLPGNPGGLTFDDLDAYIRDRLLGKPNDLREPNVILNDILNGLRGDLEDDLDTRPTRPEIDTLLDDYVRDTLLGKPDDLREPNVILNDLITSGSTGGSTDGLTFDDLDAYIKDVLGVDVTDPRDPDVILGDKFADKLDADGLNAYIKNTLLGVDATDPRGPNIILDDKISGGSPIGLTFDDLNAYIKDTLLGVDETDSRGPNVILDDKINDKIIAKLGANDLDAYIKGTLLGVETTDPRSPNIILKDEINNGLPGGSTEGLTFDELDAYIKGTLLGVETTDSTNPNIILNGILDNKLIDKLDADGLDTYIKNTLLGADEGNTGTPNEILESKFAEKLNTNGLNAALSNTSTITTINNSLSNKVDAVSGSRLITSAEGTLLQNAIQPGTLSEHYKATYSDLVDKTDDLVNDKYFIRAFDETSGDEIKMSTLSLRNSLSIIYPTARELESTGDKFDGVTNTFPFEHNLIEASAKLNKNGLIYYIGHGFSIDLGNTISLDVAPTSEDIIFIEAVYLD